jgi:hypothetical protein
MKKMTKYTTINDTIKKTYKLNKNIIDELCPSISDIVNDDKILKESEQVYSKKQLNEITVITVLIKKTFKKLNYDFELDTAINMACIMVMIKDRDEHRNQLKDFNTYFKVAMDLYISELS